MTTARSLPLYHVDAFTNSAFSGNPAAVCLIARGDINLTDAVMQKIGAEMNLSETAFIFSDGDNAGFKTGSRFGLRWFTPKTEVNLCGHATLASAAVLFDKIGNESNEICFDTLSGTLTTRRKDKLISMDFPLNPSQKQDKVELESLLSVVVSDQLIQTVEYSSTTKKLLVRLADTVTRSELEDLQPQIPRMVECEGTGKVKGVILTLRGARSNGAVDSEGRVYDFISRYFAPWVGIPEDPVTARQCSPRGGDMHIRVEGDRVHLAGEAAVIMQGTLDI